MEPVQKTIKMTKSQWEKWDTALRSGEIKQGRSGLIDRRDGSMCCLGVLEHALEGEVEFGHGYPSTEFLERNGISFLDATGYIARHNDPAMGCGKDLSCLNDDDKLSFKQIAARIKNRVEFIPE